MAKTDFNILGGGDIGNGYVKGKFACDGETVLVDMPSCVSYISAANSLSFMPDNAYMDDLYNELDCDIVSNAIPVNESMRLVFGKRAVASGNTPVIFNIDDATPKCEDPLSVQLVLGIFASIATRAYWKKHGELPKDTLHVTANVGLALPISDFKAYREIYARKFTGTTHTVNIRNFEQLIRVDIVFDQVTVLAEGAAAQYAITDLGAKFLDAALAASIADGMPVDDEETGETLLSRTSVCGVDVGEGTVNFPVFRDGKLSAELSSSINKGYGTVLSNVVAQLRNHPAAPQSRKDLAEFMVKKNPNGRDRKLQALFQTYLDAEIRVFVRDVIAEYTSVLSKAKLNLDVVYVYGGGANAVRSLLYPALIKASKLADGIYMPVVYLDSSYSRDLNRNGLYQVAQLAANAKATNMAGVATGAR